MGRPNRFRAGVQAEQLRWSAALFLAVGEVAMEGVLWSVLRWPLDAVKMQGLLADRFQLKVHRLMFYLSNRSARSMAATSLFIPGGTLCSSRLACKTKAAFVADKTSRCVIRLWFSDRSSKSH